MACLQGTYQCSMNRMNNIKRKIISDFCCALCARGVFNGILTRMSFPKTIPMSIPRARPIDGYTNPIIIPIHTPMVCHRLWLYCSFEFVLPLFLVLCVGQQIYVVVFTVNTLLFVVEGAFLDVPFGIVEFGFIRSGSYCK